MYIYIYSTYICIYCTVSIYVYIYIHIHDHSKSFRFCNEGVIYSVPGKAVRPSEDNSLAIDIAVIVQLPRSVA